MTCQEEIEYFENLNAAAENAILGNFVEIPKTIETSEQFIEWVRYDSNPIEAKCAVKGSAGSECAILSTKR
jgi:hypothetical protein